MKKIFTLLLTLHAGIGTIFAWNYEKVHIGDLYYNLDATKHIAEVTYGSSYSELTSANIPDSVLYNNEEYRVTSIGKEAFSQCDELISVIIGNSVTSIGESAFEYSSNLAYVTIGSGVTFIGEDAFDHCYDMTEINVAADNPTYCSEEGILFNKEKTTLIKYPRRKQGAYIVPNSVISIEANAFKSNDNLTAVTLGDSVAEIGRYAFFGCTGLTYVTINAETPPTLGYSAFEDSINCPIYVPCGAADLYTSAEKWTDYADAIGYMPLPYSLQVTVKDNTGGSVMFPKDLCDSMVLVAVPDSDYGYHFVQWNDGIAANPRSFVLTQDTAFVAVFTIDTAGTCGKDYALYWSYDSIARHLTISGEGAFDEHMQYGVQAKQGMTKLTIAEGVTAIGDSAFAGCGVLATMELPQTLKTIGNYAFHNCIDLTSIYNYRINPCLVSENSFEGVNKFDCILYVPEGSVEMYQSEQSGWKDFYNIFPIPSPEGTELVGQSQGQCQKVIKNGQIVILRGEKTYNLQGQEVK